MLSSLHGKLESLGSDWAIINVHGIGFQVYLPTPTLSTLGARGGEVHLHTHLHPLCMVFLPQTTGNYFNLYLMCPVSDQR